MQGKLLRQILDKMMKSDSAGNARVQVCLPDGKYYIADKFTIVEVKNGQVVKGSAEIIKSS